MSMALSWNTSFQDLHRISGPVSDLLKKQARLTSLSKGAVIFGPDNSAENLLLLISGTVRVQQHFETGREIVLYRVHADASCVLTAASLLAFEKHTAKGIAETDVDAMVIPRATFEELMAISPQFRAAIFQDYLKRINDLFRAIKRKGSGATHDEHGHEDAQNLPRIIHH